MDAIVSQPFESNIFLSLAGVPALGVEFSDVTVQYKKFLSDTLQAKTLTAEDWIELGSGFYVLKWSEAEMGTVGKFFYTLTGALFDNFLYDEFGVILPPPAAAVYPDRCVISGNLLDLNIQPALNTVITARIVKVPSSVNNALLTARIISTNPNHLGAFELVLPRNITAVIEIPEAGIRHQITVPDQATSTLLDLLPPLT